MSSMMTEQPDDDRVALPGAAPTTGAPAAADPERPRRNSSAWGLLLVVLAVAASVYAAWRVQLFERGHDNAQAELRLRLEAIDTRLSENEQRAARNNELANTLRDQLSENARLRDRLREDLLALADRSARAEALLADLLRERRGARAQMALVDADLLLAQADARLRLFGDRVGAAAALALAEQALSLAGSDRADLRSAVADTRAALLADGRPSRSALLTELDEMAAAVADLPARSAALADDRGTQAEQRGWWARQFDRLDHLVTIRREDEVEAGIAPTRDAVRNALNRARLAVLEQDHAALPTALSAARASLLACCDAQAGTPVLAQLDRLLAIDWPAPVPDLSALRQRLQDQVEIDRLPTPALPASEAGVDDQAARSGEESP